MTDNIVSFSEGLHKKNGQGKKPEAEYTSKPHPLIAAIEASIAAIEAQAEAGKDLSHSLPIKHAEPHSHKNPFEVLNGSTGESPIKEINNDHLKALVMTCRALGYQINVLNPDGKFDPVTVALMRSLANYVYSISGESLL